MSNALIVCNEFCTEYEEITGNTAHGMTRAANVLRKSQIRTFKVDHQEVRDLVRELDNWRCNRSRNGVNCSAFNVVIPALEALIAPVPLEAELSKFQAQVARLRNDVQELRDILDEKDEEIADHRETIDRLTPADSESEIDRRVGALENTIRSCCADLEGRDSILITGEILEDGVSLKWERAE